jgi:16S rRNA G966 N2-methylase RsmD
LRRLKGVIAAADLVLLDPPYGGGAAGATLAALAVASMLKPGARVVVEHHAKDFLPDETGRLERAGQRRYGETVMSTYRAKTGVGPLSAEEE